MNLALDKLRISKVDFFIFIITIACCFPYTRIIPINSITQPYALILSILFIIAFHRNISFKGDLKIILALFFLLISGFVVFLFTNFTGPSFGATKWFVSYLSPFIFFYIYRHFLNLNKKLVTIALKISIVLWFLVAFIQKAFNYTFLTFLTSERHSEASAALAGGGRGVYGLAHEPTHHAFHMILMVASLNLIKRDFFFSILGLISIVFFAMSSSALLCFLLAAFILFIRLDLLNKLSILLFFLSLFFLFSKFLPEESRINELFTILISDPSIVIEADYSLNMRLGGLYASIVTSFQNYLLPHGLNYIRWLEEINIYYLKFPWIYEISEEGWPSGYFVILYQIGFLAFPLFYILFILYKHAVRQDLLVAIFLLAALNIFIFQFNITSPFFGILITLVAVRKKFKQYNNAPEGFNNNSNI